MTNEELVDFIGRARVTTRKHGFYRQYRFKRLEIVTDGFLPQYYVLRGGMFDIAREAGWFFAVTYDEARLSETLDVMLADIKRCMEEKLMESREEILRFDWPPAPRGEDNVLSMVR